MNILDLSKIKTISNLVPSAKDELYKNSNIYELLSFELNFLAFDNFKKIFFIDGDYKKDLSDDEIITKKFTLHKAEKNNFFLELAKNTNPKMWNIVLDKTYKLPIFIKNSYISNGYFSQFTKFKIETNTINTLVEKTQKISGKKFINSYKYLKIEKNSYLEYIIIQNSNLKSGAVSNYNIEVADNSTLNLFLFEKGNKTLLTILNCILHENAQINLYGINDLIKNQNHSFIINITHKDKRSKSTQNFKYLLDDSSKVLYSSKIVIKKQAIKSEASQVAKAILLSEDSMAKINSKPHLEIYTDDVKANHGSAIGSLDSEQLFYLRSRGLSDKKAKEILTDAFKNEVIEFISNKDTREFVKKELYKGEKDEY